MEEGISHGAAALACDQQLGNLVVVYDDNNISIEDDTNIAKSEDIAARYEAYGWHVQRLTWGTAGRLPRGRAGAVRGAADGSGRRQTAPSFIALRTIIALARSARAEHRRCPRRCPGC